MRSYRPTALEHSVKREIKRSLIVVLTGHGHLHIKPFLDLDKFDESKYK